MKRKEEIEAYAEKLLIPIMEEHKFELVDVEYVKEGSEWYLRAYIDKDGGIAIDDCVDVSHEFEALLDRDDCIEGGYILEVSSPGLGRPLKKEKDYVRALGKEIDIKLYSPIDKCKEFTGVLDAFDKDTVTIITEEGVKNTFEKNNIALIRMAFDF